MDKLLEIKVGGGTVRSGWVPLAALQMVRDLLDAIAAEGVDEEIWKSTDPQLEVVGKGSTLIAVHTNFARKLRPQVKTFREKAKRLVLNPEAREFVKKHVANPAAHWTYVDVIEIPAKKEAKEPEPEKARILRFDAKYKERFLQKQLEPIHGFDEIYAEVMRAGGTKPTVTLKLSSGESGTYSVRGRDLAKRVASRLYDTVKLQVEAWWNANTLELENLVVLDILEWRDVHLAEVYREHGNRLPIKLSVDSVEELLAEREADRSE